MKKHNLKEFFLLVFLFCLSFILRLYKIDNPVADWHSWRQSDTAAVARNLYQDEFNPFYPRAHNFFPMSEGSLPNSGRLFLNEFPLYNSIVALLYNLSGINEACARGVSAFFSSLGTVFLYLLVRYFVSSGTALLTAFFYAVLPFNVYYGRVIMPDPTFIFLSILSLYSIKNWLEKEKMSLAILSGFSLALAMLVKPYAIFLGLPISYLVLKKWGKKAFARVDVYLIALLSLLPLIFWRWHINKYPEGMFGADWLINQGGIRFKGAFFRWLIFERMNRLIFATGGFVLFWLGLIAPRTKKEGLFFLTWLLAIVAYLTYFARGNVTHDYYQLPLVPVGCVLMGKGFAFLWSFGKDVITRLTSKGLAISFVLIMLAFGWYETRGFFNINHPEIIAAGKAVQRLTPEDARVIAPYNRDPAFLYQTNRNGWSDTGDIQKWVEEEGATHYVSVKWDELTTVLMNSCPVLEKTNAYVIVELQNCDLEKQEISP